MFPLWFIIAGSTVVYLFVTFLLNQEFSLGEVKWWQRILTALWPVTLPLLLLIIGAKAIFWPDA